MKTQLISVDGKKGKEIELPEIFEKPIREDIAKKTFEAEKILHPYGPNPESGKKHSAAGIIRHLRHVWKSGYGSGRSRVPRKIMWRRGSQFYWVGASANSTRGGRRAHGPKANQKLIKKKINRKEKTIAFETGISATINSDFVKKRYERLKNLEAIKLPIVFDSSILKTKTQEFIKKIEENLGDLSKVAKSEKKIRSGKGKLRNRKYRKSPGLLFVVGNDEELKSNIFEVKKVKEIMMRDLYPLGRLTVYTEQAIKDLGGKNDKKTNNN